MSEKTTKDLVLEGRDEGNVVFLQHGGDDFAVMSAPIEEFIQQPADGILYDLNRLEEIALTYMDDPKWVNDFAVALTIRALKEERDALLAMVPFARHKPECQIAKAWGYGPGGTFTDPHCNCGFLTAHVALPEYLKEEVDG